MPEADLSALSGIDLVFPAAVLSNGAVVYQGNVLDSYELYPKALCFVAASEQGLEDLKSLAEEVIKVSDCKPPPLLHLNGASHKNWEQELQSTLLRVLAQEVRAAAERNVLLNRSIALMRKEQERILDNFSKMENFVLSHNLIERRLLTSLEPSPACAPLEISSESSLEQRLPVSSSGLSDVMVFVDDVDPDASGVLEVILFTIEDSEICAKWHIASEKIRDKRLRLSLPVSLSGDAMTPSLRVRWVGEGVVSLATSLHNPDTRYQASHPDNSDGRVLALRCWSYIPGSQAPLPAGAHLPVGKDKEPVRTVLVTPESLEKFINITAPEEYVRVVQDGRALQVHAMKGETTSAVIQHVVPVNTSKIVAEITTTSENGPKIEYALGLLPTPRSGSKFDVERVLGTGIMSDWVPMTPLDVGEVQLLLPRALEAPHDLYLMTRLAQGQEDDAWAWSTFRNIRVTIGQEPDHDR